MARGSRNKRRGAPGAGVGMDTGGYDPRALQQLTDAQIGPGMMALAEEIAPRSTEYMNANQRRMGPLPYARGKSFGLSFQTLRAIGDNSLINAAIHQRRADGMRALCRRWSGRRHQPGWAVVHKDHNDPRVDASQVADLDKRIAIAEAILLNPHPRFATCLEDVILPLIDDKLCIDRPCLNVIWNSLGTEPLHIVPVDGASVWPVDIWTDQYVRLNGLGTGDWGRNLELGFKGAQSEYGTDLTTKTWVQVDPSRGIYPVAFLDDREMIVGVANKTSRMEQWGYGRSPCERSWIASTLYLFGIGYVMDFFKNSFANKIGTIEGIVEQDAVTLVNVLRTQHTGAGRHFHTPMIPLPPGAKMTFQDTRATSQQMEFNESMHHVSMLLAAFYSEDSGSINLTQKGPGTGASLSEPNQDADKAIKRSEGLVNDMHFICDRFLTPLIRRIDPDLKVIAAGIDDEKEELEVKLRDQRVGSWMGIDEARIEEGREPFGEEWSRYPKTQAQALFQNTLQMQMQKAQAQMGQQPGGQGGPPGQGGDDEGGGDQPGQGDDPQKGMPQAMRLEPHRDEDGGGDQPGQGNPPPERMKAAAWVDIVLDEPAPRPARPE